MVEKKGRKLWGVLEIKRDYLRFEDDRTTAGHTVQLAVLGFLAERAYHGYELTKTIERKMGVWTDIKFGSVYNALATLLRSRCVERQWEPASPGKPARAIYSITDRGRAKLVHLLADNLSSLHKVVLKDDLGIYLGNWLARPRLIELLEQKVKVLEELAEALRKHRDELTNYTTGKLEAAWWMVTRHLRHVEADLNWFRSVLGQVKNLKLYG